MLKRRFLRWPVVLPDPLPPDANPEQDRLAEIGDDLSCWRNWGPYLADRAWGTVREDYSADGDAWRYLPYESSRFKAYRWGEDGIAGISDRYQWLCFAPAFWNGVDDHLKERYFGVNPYEGNHGEDVKDYYVHVDNLPSHAYMALLYRYPQRPFPYRQLVQENQRRQGQGPEYELIDTGVFEGDRYFDIRIEYAKVSPEDLCIRITARNCGPEAADLHVLPTLWFRNTWRWGPQPLEEPAIRVQAAADGNCVLVADDAHRQPELSIPDHYRLGQRRLYGPAGGQLLFTDNETRAAVVYGPGNVSHTPYTKEAFHRYLCEGDRSALKPTAQGTKAALHYRQSIPAGETWVLRLRLSDQDLEQPVAAVDAWIERRRQEADRFYERLAPGDASADERLIQRRALAGLLWSKQCYIFDVDVWLTGDNPNWPPPPGRAAIRNRHWRHLNSLRVLSMPDKWEYPWFAAWDLAFQAVPFALIDPAFAKDQLWFLLFEQFQHPNGQLPAYEWEFNDLNPPVHAWAVWRVYNMDRQRNGRGDRPWLERCFHKLLLNFTSWVNQVDREGNNIFEGGFLGLDNITVVDRSQPLGQGAVLEQSDATGWMGMFCLNLMRIALELARENPVYEGLATKFFEHYTYIGYAMKQRGDRDAALYDAADGFFYDLLRYPDGRTRQFRVRSLVGLIPLFAVERLEEPWITPFTEFRTNLTWFLKNRPELVSETIHPIHRPDGSCTYLLTIVNQHQLRQLLTVLLDPQEFLAPYGIRSLSRRHASEPFEFKGLVVGYEPAESISKLKGGNSNWRGPIWFPTSFLIIESLRKLGTAYGPQARLKLPGRPGPPPSFHDLARDLARRLVDLFRLNADGRRPVWGEMPRFRDHPDWRDELMFFEYFHGDNGSGLGASHQTGWTALVANLIDEWR